MIEGLYTNRSKDRDFIKNALEGFATKCPNAFVAVAFFTAPELIAELLARNCHVRLVVRLGFPTRPKALAELLGRPNLEIRYFTSPSFHPKLYIFGDEVSLVGSANLTDAAVLTNQEILVTIPSHDARFGELAALFSEYWADAKVLTKDVLAAYSKLCSAHSVISKELHKLEQDVLSTIGNVVSGNIDRGLPKESSENIFLESYRKTYQESLAAFQTVADVYASVHRRKARRDEVPLRIEIDSFISFVRERHARGEIWETEPLLSGEEQRQKIRNLVDEWFSLEWEYFDNTIVKHNYPRIQQAFGSPSDIQKLTAESMFHALTVVHSFRERLRFYPGGLDTLKDEFLAANELAKLKASFTYLLHGPDEVVKRLANIIYNAQYKPNVFGQANAQELLGWVGKEGYPVINGRTTKVLRYFGFDVRQLA